MTLNIEQYLEELKNRHSDLLGQIDKAEQSILEENISFQLSQNSLSSQVNAELEDYKPQAFELDLPKHPSKVTPTKQDIESILNQLFKIKN